MDKMGILGPPGTHSEAAALYLNERLPEPQELVPYADIYAVLQAVEQGEVDTALVPVENSLEGSINVTLDLLARTDTLLVRRELIWPVHNQLMAKCGPGEVKRIFSHPQPISQCRHFLQEHYPHAELVKVASTARAAELVGDVPADTGFAAICTKRGGELNGLRTLAADIQDNMANRTRFFEVAKRGRYADGTAGHPDKVLIICQIDGHEAGALCKVLEEFAFRDVNMTRIESRPARTELGAYIFFFDLETRGVTEEALRASIEACRARSIWLRNLGAFPVLEAAI